MKFRARNPCDRLKTWSPPALFRSLELGNEGMVGRAFPVSACDGAMMKSISNSSGEESCHPLDGMLAGGAQLGIRRESCAATARNAWASALSGAVATTGRPASELSRIAITSGISPRNGRPIDSAACGRRHGRRCRSGAGIGGDEVAHVLDEAEIGTPVRAACRWPSWRRSAPGPAASRRSRRPQRHLLAPARSGCRRCRAAGRPPARRARPSRSRAAIGAAPRSPSGPRQTTAWFGGQHRPIDMALRPKASCGSKMPSCARRLALDAEQALGHRGAIEIGIEHAGAEAFGGKGQREVDRDGRLADAALARADGDDVADTGHRLRAAAGRAPLRLGLAGSGLARSEVTRP
jgi:hypothetical protein